MKGKPKSIKFYEEVSKIAEELEEDPFTSEDIVEVTDQTYNFVGRALTEASENEEYSIERFGIEHGPNAYTLKERVDKEENLKHVEDLYISNEVMNEFEDEIEVERSIVERFISEKLEEEGISKVGQLQRTGYIVDHLEERGDLELNEQTTTYRVIR